jgi:hypothetical protein
MYMNLICIIRANSYIKSITVYQGLHNSLRVSVWVYSIVRGTFIEHFETTEEKHSFSYLKGR